MRIERVGVVGAGTMGRGITLAAAQAGFAVTLRDVEDRFLKDARAFAEQQLSKAVEKGKVTPADREATLSKIRFTKDFWTLANESDLVIEAVPEDLVLKQKVFKDLDEIAPEAAILATNTSSLSVARIADGTRHPGRVVGMHFFNPAHLMRLVEIVRHGKSDPEAVQQVVEAARRMGKETIVVNDAPGFASSRLGIALGLEAMRMVEEGVASPEDIDRAMEVGYNHPMGPLKLTDLVGLDVRLAIAEHLARELGPRYEPPKLLRVKVKAGELGRKSGKGFYAYSKE